MRCAQFPSAGVTSLRIDPILTAVHIPISLSHMSRTLGIRLQPMAHPMPPTIPPLRKNRLGREGAPALHSFAKRFSALLRRHCIRFSNAAITLRCAKDAGRASNKRNSFGVTRTNQFHQPALPLGQHLQNLLLDSKVSQPDRADTIPQPAQRSATKINSCRQTHRRNYSRN